MKKSLLLLSLFSLLTFTSSIATASPHHPPMGHKGHRPPMHHNMHRPPMHHHHVRHSSFIYPSYYRYHYPYINLHFPMGRINHPIHSHLGATFHISI